MAIVAPHDVETERQLIGALMVRSQIIPDIDSQMKSEDLYLESHRLIYNTIIEQNRSGMLDIDAIQVSQRLSDLKNLERSGGTSYVMSLAQNVIAPGNAIKHCQRIKTLSVRRNLIRVANEIVEESSQAIENESSFLRKVEDKILQITNESFSSEILSTAELKLEFQSHIRSLLEAKGKISGLKTGFRDFDKMTAGLKKGELIVVAARPGLGKTTFALNLASNIATEADESILLYSLEMSQIEIMMRLVCSRVQIPHDHLKRGQVNASRKNDLDIAIDEICRSQIYIDDTGDLSIWECMARTRKFKLDMEQQGKKLSLVIVDYLQLMSDPGARKLGRQHEVATISRCLKQLARIVEVPLIAVSQMNRLVEQRRGRDKRPQLSDLRESGAIEQDADIVMFIHHDQQEDSDEQGAVQTEDDLANMGTVEVIVAKHRNGPVGNFRLSFRPHINRFDSTDIRI